MARSNEFLDYLLEQLSPLGPATYRKMFGGYGLYLDGVMFALVAEETLYLKTDEINRPDFTVRALPPFIYTRQGKPVQLSYFLAPDDALEEPEELRDWARKSLAAARRSDHKRRRR